MQKCLSGPILLFMLVEAAPKIDRRYVLAPEIDPEFVEAFIDGVPSCLGKPPIRHMYAFLSVVPRVNFEEISLRAQALANVGKEPVSIGQNGADKLFSIAGVLSGSKQGNVGEAVKILKEGQTVSLDALAGDNLESSLLGFIPDPSADILTPVLNSSLGTQLEEVFALARLSLRERDIVMKRVVVGMSLEAVGKDFGVTRERIRQIEAVALKKLKGTANRTGLRSFLES